MDSYITPEWLLAQDRKLDAIIAEMRRRNPEGKKSKLGEWLRSNEPSPLVWVGNPEDLLK